MLLLAIVAFGVPLAINLRARVNAEVRTQAQGQADLIAATAADLLAPNDRHDLATLTSSGANSVRGRVLIVDPRGSVVADSASPAQLGSSYASRPEIQAALKGRQIQVQRPSRTLGKQILATAVPIVRHGRAVGAVRVTQSVVAVQSAVNRAELGLLLVAIVVLALGLAAGLVIARQVAGPLRRLDGVAREVAQGNLGARARLEGSREQRSLAHSFNEMTDRISRLLAAQQRFVADASHQLRTPLTALRLRLDEARAQAPGNPAASELDAATAEVDRLSHTVDELLELSRAGERSLQGAAIDLADLARGVAERWRVQAIEKGIALRARPIGDAGMVWAARSDLERALDVLVENALGYAPAGTEVAVSAAPGVVSVCDHGPGIPVPERELVFERFRRGNAASGGVPGSGLGLAIARELARAWDGEIMLTETPGGGTTAILSLHPSSGAENDRALPVLNPAAGTVETR